MEHTHLIYYSPALSTKKSLRLIAKGIGLPFIEHDITQGLPERLSFQSDEIVIFGVPAYAGRVPAMAANDLRKIKGNNTPAVFVCVYGNRDYDDALLELKDICQSNGFSPMAAGAFVARHSIFPKVGEGRPDKTDEQSLIEFGKKCIHVYQSREKGKKKPELDVKGNSPYREPSKIPFVPKGDSKCDNCGTCVKMCPVNAIPLSNPRNTDKRKCISCARCITVCPQHSRKFKGLLYQIVKRKFESSYTERKEPEIFF